MDIVHGAIGIIKSVFGIDCVTTQLQYKRLLICSKCKKLKNKKCMVCGCYLKYKSRLKSEKCPKGYW